MAKLGAFDIGVPIKDNAGRKLGMIVVVIPAARAADAADAMRQVLSIRDVLQSRIASLGWLFEGAAMVQSPLVMVAQTPLPNVRGGFSQLGVDLAGDRLYAVADDNHTVEVFDLAGEYLKSESGSALPRHLELSSGTKTNFPVDASMLAFAGSNGDISLDTSGGRVFVTGSQGLAVYRKLDNGGYLKVSQFGTMGGNRSIYVPSKKLLYVIHGKNAEDGAGLQVYEVK